MKPYFTFCITLLISIQLFAQPFRSIEIEPNTFQIQMKVDGLNREFLVHLPPAYQSEPDQSFPVVFMFHGGGGTGKKFYHISKWRELGDQEGFITVFPTAYKTCIIKDGRKSEQNYWMTESKASSVCPGTSSHDDIVFVQVIVDHLNNQYRVDKTRFYASGFSNGMGMILSRLLVEMGDTFAALSGVGSLIQDAYETDKLVPVFCLLGQNDKHLEQWAGISAPVSDVGKLLDETILTERVDMILKTMNLNDTFVERERPKYILRRYTETTDGGNQELQFGILKDLGHVYPHGGSQHNDIVIAKVFWDFFKTYSLEP